MSPLPQTQLRERTLERDDFGAQTIQSHFGPRTRQFAETIRTQICLRRHSHL
jgi:hypothetical protein